MTDCWTIHSGNVQWMEGWMDEWIDRWLEILDFFFWW